MVDIKCEKCNIVQQDNFKIVNLQYNHKVKPGDVCRITGKIECLNTIFAGAAKICLYEDNTLLNSTVQQTINPGESKSFEFQFLMDNQSRYLNLSLLGQNVFTYDCEDFKDIYIESSNYTEPVIPDKFNFTYILIGIGLIAVAIIFKVVSK